MKAEITVLAGDGIGPEITEHALNILNAIEKKYGHEFTLHDALFGGIAIDETGDPYPLETRELCKKSDAVLLGAVGGPKWNDPKAKTRPEKGLLDMRSDLGVYANLRQIKTYPQLIDNSPIENAKLKEIDILFVRELIGGIYFGEKEKTDNYAKDVCEYSASEIERIVKVAADLSMKRKNKLTSVDKANVMATSQLWRSVTTALIKKEYPEIEIEHLLVDAATMHLLSRPADFDVIVAENLFGDILTDEASMLTGSIGMIPSASLGDNNFGVYEPIHGSAPDIQGKGLANPSGMILSVAMMLKHSFNLIEESDDIENAVEEVLSDGIFTADLSSEDHVSTDEMGNAILSKIV
ncbi:MAG: 3-isopropylmalate dehydrogenase [Gammaproteobacteria bacterium]|mgnify:CR=1 FL=1|nr:3-isopropylmalate dehydrogenase [Gammaproteobacteria bacterium]